MNLQQQIAYIERKQEDVRRFAAERRALITKGCSDALAGPRWRAGHWRGAVRRRHGIREADRDVTPTVHAGLHQATARPNWGFVSLRSA